MGFVYFFSCDLVLISHSGPNYLYPLCFHLNFLLKPGQTFKTWQLFLFMQQKGEWWQVPQEPARVCRWLGCWPAKLISHSPGSHNASRVTMGINRRSEWETGRVREGEILEGKYSRTASLSLGWRLWLWRPAACLGIFLFFFQFTSVLGVGIT